MDNSNNLIKFIGNKIAFFESKIHEITKFYYYNKINNILSLKQYIDSLNLFNEISSELKTIDSYNKSSNTNLLIEELNKVNKKLSAVICKYGIPKLEDLLNISIEYNYLSKFSEYKHIQKLEIIKEYFHPLSLAVLSWDKENEKIEDLDVNDNVEIFSLKNLGFYNVTIGESKNKVETNFFIKLYNCYLVLQNESKRETYLIKGYCDNINILNFINKPYINEKLNEFLDESSELDFKKQFLETLELKDLFLYNNLELKSKYLDVIQLIKAQSVRNIQNIIKEFLKLDLFEKRHFLICLLVIDIFTEQQYLAYLLYDLMTKDANGNIDSLEQTLLYDSFPYPLKIKFQESMEKTIQYTEELNSLTSNPKVSYENQIALMKCSDQIKEKAIQKLKEIKGKNDDSLLKAKNYLEGLLRIPFGILRVEPILDVYNTLKGEITIIQNANKLPSLDCNNLVDLMVYCNKHLIDKSANNKYDIVKLDLDKCSKKRINKLIEEIKLSTDEFKLVPKVNSNKNVLTKQIIDFVSTNPSILDHMSFNELISVETKKQCQIYKTIQEIPKKMQEIRSNLDTCVYGHEEAKKQIERIIGQWISGDRSGHCFGFEGPPGVGKTTLAKKGIANCLLDAEGCPRPFSMIQLGGDSNGSSLHGHNYTYVGSNWGNIVQILMDSKCMNPIIFIDEVDKVSKTENGREIIGILTHLLDVSQNDSFQDKYFAGINIDLSKALFILSYNDVELIDRILLDRIHRIKFNHLSLDEKIVICKKHILPELLNKMGLEDKIIFTDDVIRFIIEKFTNESGVRKLKELLFNIIGDINLDILNNGIFDIKELPMVITQDDVTKLFLKDRVQVKHKMIHSQNCVGIINGLWANAYGHGGIIPIQTSFFPCNQNLQLKLTGMQGDVMKESMNVALTIAWEKTSVKRQKQLIAECKNNNKGVHIHCPEGAVPKDGPSAGGAITTAIFSLLNNIKINHTFGITGEIALDGNITAIGGLDLKIMGGIRAGIKEFIFPEENIEDFEKCKKKLGEKMLGVKFHSVRHIDEVFNLILDYDT